MITRATLDSLIEELPSVSTDEEMTRTMVVMAAQESAEYADANDAEVLSACSGFRQMLQSRLDDGDTPDRAFASSIGALVRLGLGLQVHDS